MKNNERYVGLTIYLLSILAALMFGCVIGYSACDSTQRQATAETPTETPQIVYNIYVTLPDELEEELKEENTAVGQEITRDFDIFKPCGYTYEQLSAAVNTECHSGMQPHIKALMKAEEEYGVNAFYLLCKFGLESGWGRYTSGANNIGGWTNNSGGFKDFDSVEQCILHIAKNLSTTYKEAVGGRLEDVCKRYCPDAGYIETLIGIMTEREAAMKGE